MSHWQRRARLFIAIGAVAFAVVVALAFKRRAPSPDSSAVATTDPKAVIETASGSTWRFNREHEDVRVEYEHLVSYPDGAMKLLGITVVTQRAGGRTFTITGREGDVAKDESEFSLTGDVHITNDDGLAVRTERATYAENDGVVRAPDAVDFSRGRMSGSAVGMTYDRKQNVMTLLDQVVLHMTPDAKGGALDVSAPAAVFNRNDQIVHFDRGLKATRGPQTIQADLGLVHLSPDENRLEAVELRGNSRMTGGQSGVGGLRSLDGRDIDLKYGADGETIEHALVVGNAAIQLAGPRGQAGRQVTANTVELSFAPDGATPTGLAARGNVQLVFPPEPRSAGRTINAQSLDSRGDPDHGLTTAHFDGGVRYREQGPGVDRRAVSQALDAALSPGMGMIEEARFARSVRFEDGSMTAVADNARYMLDKGTLDLAGADNGAGVPRLDTDRIAVDAAHIDLTLEGPLVKASGTVKSTLKPPKKEATGGRGAKPSDTKIPSMLKSDQDVTVTAGGLDYDGTVSKATYSGDARLYQGETTIKAETIVIDDRNGDLAASGAEKTVATSMVREQLDKNHKTERVPSTATAKNLKYEDATRRLTYDGDAHVIGPAGDMTAARIELYLKPSGDEIERVEAYDGITLREQNGRKTTGTRMTYVSADEQYIVTGAPVTVLDTCGRETKGKTLTMYRATDRIVVDGNEQTRTETRGGSSNCP